MGLGEGGGGLRLVIACHITLKDSCCPFDFEMGSPCIYSICCMSIQMVILLIALHSNPKSHNS